MLFCILLPAGLFIWAQAAEELVPLRAPQSAPLGLALIFAGSLLILSGMAALWIRGGGLPMNAFPPPHFVSSGIYAWLHHPIYAGFSLLCAGFAVFYGSAAALWLVTPSVIGCSTALVLGYELPDLHRRFPEAPLSDAGGVLQLLLTAWLPGLLIAASVGALDAAVAAISALCCAVAAGSSAARRQIWLLLVLLPFAFCWFPDMPQRLFAAGWSVLFVWLAGLRFHLRLRWFFFVPYLLFPSAPGTAAGTVAALAVIEWAFLRRAAERIANSWHEWRIGPVRIINHGFYIGLATIVGVLVIAACIGPGHQSVIAFTVIASLLGAGLWAQFLEGSPRLLRPFGFYGGMIGAILASWIIEPGWLLLAAWCMAAPWIQMLGRFRCLVQGCCHGAPTSSTAGIRYRMPQSRVLRISGLDGLPLHATQLYSMLGNLVIGTGLIRLWTMAAPLHLIAGVYLLSSGAARFAEEAYRGEPQTPIWKGLRLYQWIAIGSVVAGAWITAAGRSAPAPKVHWPFEAIPVALLCGLITTIAMGVDFPASSRRFSRLT